MLYKYFNSFSKPKEKMSNQKKIDGILTNSPVLIKYKSGLIKKYQKIE